MLNISAFIACIGLRLPSRRRGFRLLRGCVWLMFAVVVLPLIAQDDVTTQYAGSAMNGAFITGPASNPLSFLNGPAYRTFGSNYPYDLPDFAPASALNANLPQWIAFQAEERLRTEEYRDGNFQAGNDDFLMLNRFRLEADMRATSWFRVSAQVQDARAMLQKPPTGPPNENRWELKLAYTEIGDPEKHWFSLRVGRQMINYNNTLLANSEWRNQGRSYDAAVVNLQSDRAHLGIFAASAVLLRDQGVSHHVEGNNIYGLYGRIDDLLPHSNLEPFVLWRVQPAAVIEPAISKAVGKQDMKAYGVRLKGLARGLDYSAEGVVENGKIGNEPIRAWAITEGVAYRFNAVRGQPRVFAQHDLGSGNSNPAGGVHHTFDAMYPTAHDRFGILDQFGWENLQTVRAGVTVEPHHRWTATAQGLDFWVVSALDAIYNTSGGAIGANAIAHGRHVGAEGDVYTWYELNQHFNIGAGFGWFGGGSFLSHIGTSHGYSSSYIALNFKDNGRYRRK